MSIISLMSVPVQPAARKEKEKVLLQAKSQILPKRGRSRRNNIHGIILWYKYVRVSLMYKI